MVEFKIKMEEGKTVDVSVNDPTPINIDVKTIPTIKTEIFGAGPRGKSGKGVPAGGSTGQIIRKKSDADHDSGWEDFDYGELMNKPTIEGVPLEGDTSFPMLHLNALSNTELENLLII